MSDHEGRQNHKQNLLMTEDSLWSQQIHGQKRDSIAQIIPKMNE